MVALSKEELRQVQFIQLEMLEEVDRICKKCNIQYNIIAGTLLGAVRHGGYIPWDDDADVAFLRPEYEKFRKACMTELDTERFYFQDYKNTKGYRWGYGKLRRKGTVFLREHQEHMPYEQGIFIDIFPLDNVPDNYPLRVWHNFHCFCIRKVLWAEVGKRADNNIVARKWYSLLSYIPLSVVFRHYERFVIKWNDKNSRWVRILTYPTPRKTCGYLKKWYESSSEYSFEQIKVQGIKEFDAYLSFKFGDYMTLPPMRKQKIHPVSKLKLIQGKFTKNP